MIGPSVPEAKGAPLSFKESAARQTETIVSGLGIWVVKSRNLMVLIYFLTSFFCETITKTLLSMTRDKGRSCFGILLLWCSNILGL